MNKLKNYIKMNFMNGIKYVARRDAPEGYGRLMKMDRHGILKEVALAPNFTAHYYFWNCYGAPEASEMKRVAHENYAEAVEAYKIYGVMVRLYTGVQASEASLNGGKMLKKDAEALCTALMYKYLEEEVGAWKSNELWQEATQ